MASKPKSQPTRVKTPAPQPPNRTRLTRAGSKASPPAAAAPPDSSDNKTASRKPLVSRDNSPEPRPASRIKSQAPNNKLPSSQSTLADIPVSADREPIRAYLRIRPQLKDEEQSTPYLDPLTDTSVRMSDPSSSTTYSRLSSVNASSIYKFSHIFPPATQQSEFFNKTTLPLVKDVLEGQNCLLFTYGVTNSGKTYTIQGGNSPGSAGILPRTLDVVFNSIDSLHGDARYRPIRLQGIERADEFVTFDPTLMTLSDNSSPALADVLADLPSSTDSTTDPTTLQLDRNYEYTIWLSYAEVYNEKVYDLFANIDEATNTQSGTPHSGVPRSTSIFNLPIPSSQSHPLLLTRKALPLKPCPAADADSSADSTSSGRYVAGLRQLHVKSAADAKTLLKLGQLHRRVFGTLANSQSSRSHALVTIKVLRVHRGERNDPSAIQVSRLTLVDLAGSERTKHTHTTGERLREAGNINKSLMVLGQCMETMRANQRIVARSLAAANARMDTRDVKKGLAVVPFRHSKLTEMLMDYFVGEGRAVMIVNVNPYDTGYDENSHVMKFASLAREVCTVAPSAIPRAAPSNNKARPGTMQSNEVAPHIRKVTISTGGPGRKMSEAHLEVLEEDEEPEEGGDDNDQADEPINPLVDALFDEIEELRLQVFEAEMRTAIIEAETREEVMREMEERMRTMERMYTKRLMSQFEQNEMKMDAKIDMMQHSNLLGKSTDRRPPSVTDENDLEDITEEEEEVETSLREEDDGSQHDEYSPSDNSSSPSPLANKTSKASKTAKGKKQAAMHPASSQSEVSDVETMNSGRDATYLPKLAHAPLKGIQPKSHGQLAPPPILKTDAKAGHAKPQRAASGNISKLAQELDELEIGNEDDSIVIIPNKQARQEAVIHGGPHAEYVPRGSEVDTGKKKKRQLGKKHVVTEAEIDRVTAAVDSSRDIPLLRRSLRGRP